jgi:putative heme-binding domain-containing protein
VRRARTAIFFVIHSALLATALCALSAEDSAQSGTFYLPKNPVAAAYILGRLSNQELVQAPRSEFVYVALLGRKGLDKKYRLEALDGLSKLRHSDTLTELLTGIEDLDKKGEESLDSLHDLANLLVGLSPADLTAKRSRLESLAQDAQLPFTKQAGYAALIVADGSGDKAWELTGADTARRADLLQAIPLIPQAQIRASFYLKVEPLTKGDSSPELLRAAMTALPAIAGHEAEAFKILAGFVQTGKEAAAAVAALQQIPQKDWSNDLAQPLVESLLATLKKTPPEVRTSVDFVRTVQFATDLASLLPADQARTLTKTLRGLGPTVFVLKAVYEQLRYDKTLLVVEAGKPVAITLTNEDAMPHNIAILAPGALEEIGSAAEKLPAEPDAEGRLYVPASPKVLHATKLAPPGQSIQLAFDAPTETGDYPYVCTFPGHWRRMTGVMTVVEDVDAYLASHPAAPPPKITEWKLEDLAPDLPKLGPGRDLANGRRLFTQLACVQCHKLGGQGYAYGPDLATVFSKYKNDRAQVLEQILEPSKNIEDRYRNIEFEIKGGEPITGMVMKEEGETVTIQSGPADSLIQALKKSDIQQRRPQKSSPMPVGLLNTLSKEDIFDLLMFVESGGIAPAHDHEHPH